MFYLKLFNLNKDYVQDTSDLNEIYNFSRSSKPKTKP